MGAQEFAQGLGGGILPVLSLGGSGQLPVNPTQGEGVITFPGQLVVDDTPHQFVNKRFIFASRLDLKTGVILFIRQQPGRHDGDGPGDVFFRNIRYFRGFLGCTTGGKEEHGQ